MPLDHYCSKLGAVGGTRTRFSGVEDRGTTYMPRPLKRLVAEVGFEPTSRLSPEAYETPLIGR